jgi:hypothetical protein
LFILVVQASDPIPLKSLVNICEIDDDDGVILLLNAVRLRSVARENLADEVFLLRDTQRAYEVLPFLYACKAPEVIFLPLNIFFAFVLYFALSTIMLR